MTTKFKVKVNDTLEFNFTKADIEKLDIISISPTQFHVLQNNKSFNFELIESNFQNRSYLLSEHGDKYPIKIESNLDKLIKDIGLSITNSKKSNIIKAPMPGFILDINIKEGQEVNEGDTLLILEAMKMENAIIAPNKGVIKSVNIKKGETVEKGQLMIELQ
ncbi:MAG: biotin/lipoyl-binding protein [Flavobacteriaceae bacterium]